MSSQMGLERYFPNLRETPYHPASPASPEYNCVAWAADDQSQWWWPDAMRQGYWPREAAREETLQAFEEAYGTLGFSQCDNADLEAHFEKVAIFAKNSVPTHAARQLPDGRWTSKLGTLEDIEHETLDALEGDWYGRVALLLKRRIQ
jgi:hypothetical protein